MTFILQKAHLDKILFLDIETVSEKPHFGDLDHEYQKLWTKKATQLLKYQQEEVNHEDVDKMYKERAAIYAEFAKVVCITIGFLRFKGEKNELRIKSFYGKEEKEMLSEFGELIKLHFDQPSKFYICGHNVREFDVPFLGRRFLVNGLELPEIFNLIGKKPWESKHLLDTLEMWRFGDYKNYISLELLAKTLGVESPKVNMDGSQVGAAFWEEDRLEDIKNYCELDVATVANVFLRLNGSKAIDEVINT